jgi:Flp pilus assembly pilin Flp
MPSAEHNVSGQDLSLLRAGFQELPYQPGSLEKEESEAFAAIKSDLKMSILPQLLSDDSGQDIAEYAVMLAVILVIVVGTIRLIGSNANNAFSNVASALQ